MLRKRLRQQGLLAGALLGAAVAGVVALTPAGAGSGTRGGMSVAFLTRGGDVWAWTTRVAGRTTCARRVTLRGGRNPAAARVREGRFSASVPLREGPNHIVAACPGARPAAIDYHVRLIARPRALVRTSVRGRTVVLDGTGSRPGPPYRAPLVGFSWTARSGNPAPLRLPAGGRGATFVAPRADGEYYVTLRVVDARGRTDDCTVFFTVRDGSPAAHDSARSNAAWVEGAVVYGVIPARFGRHGFRAVTAKLDYLRRLGVDAIWLSPVNSTLPGDFGYAVTDYFGLRPDYGTKADFARLVKAAHARGIRVLMDFVPNHTSKQHPYFRDTARYGRASRYWSFYDRNPEGTYTYYFNWKHLPNLNYDNPEVRRMIVEAFSYWVRSFDVDGFRVDAAWAVTDRRPDFWRQWRWELERIKPDLLLLAEASARDSYYFESGFDAAYDWTGELGHWAWQTVFEDEATIVPMLNYAVTNPPLGYDRDALAFRFLDNNDTGRRFVAVHGVPLTRVATAALLTLPGLPCVYTGEEVGARYLPYQEETGPISFRDPFGLRPYYEKLIGLRHRFPSLRSRQLVTDVGDARLRVYDYFRFGTRSQRAVLVVLNFARRRVDAPIPLPARFRSFGAPGVLEDALAGTRVSVGRGATLRVPMEPMSARVLVAP